ncbi:hypothetical protein CTT31_13360 [Pseudoalteromonas maricaloris]|uniref:hypothetical protein n=1 Tax=Pseudoalteromonas maricaloris TaxID=184924 RepID=UPI0021ADBD41|nr:hypothetical protein [Pseudoalteromonas flavipulchra]USE70052.1 hypothetical protein CTT31_13360 [Pseudoalteromonas flavipulchra]
MEIRAGNHKLYERNFCLSEAHLRKIHSVMEAYSKKLEEPSEILVQIIRKDDSFYETADIETILIDENTEGKSIKSLSMEIASKTTGGNDKTTKRENTKAIVEFDLEGSSYIRIVTSHNSRDWCFLLVDELDTQIQRILKNKSRSFIPSRILDASFGIILMIASLFWFALRKQKENIDIEALFLKGTEDKINYLVKEIAEKNNNSSDLFILPIMFTGILVFILLLEFKPLSKLLKLTNLSVFYWGDMISIYDASLQKRSRIKWGGLLLLLYLYPHLLYSRGYHKNITHMNLIRSSKHNDSFYLL